MEGYKPLWDGFFTVPSRCRRRAGGGCTYHAVVRDHALTAPDDEKGVARSQVIVRRVRGASLRAARRADWIVHRGRYPRPMLGGSSSGLDRLLHVQHVPLRRGDAGATELLERGKRINVALAAPSLDGVLLPPGLAFSFWRAVGAPSAALGYRHGMEVRGGCVVPALGGGLCLLTNALFRAAAELGWEILERHGHTMEAIPSSDLPWGVDATAAWPYIDLRVAVPAGDSPVRLGVRVHGDVLVVEVWGAVAAPKRIELVADDDRVELVGGQRIRRNRILRRSLDGDGRERVEVIAVNVKRLLSESDLDRSCLTCDLTDCAGRVNVP